MFKTLLINGSSVEFLMRSESLKNHFCFVLYFCENLVGYSLDSKHKSFLVKCLRMTSSSLILAVGDGFNDMAMLKEAHVGVQLAAPDVPLIFGDIVISDLSQLKRLLFVNGRQIYTNLSLLNIFTLAFSALLVFYTMTTSSYTLLSD